MLSEQNKTNAACNQEFTITFTNFYLKILDLVLTPSARLLLMMRQER